MTHTHTHVQLERFVFPPPAWRNGALQIQWEMVPMTKELHKYWRSLSVCVCVIWCVSVFLLLGISSTYSDSFLPWISSGSLTWFFNQLTASGILAWFIALYTVYANDDTLVSKEKYHSNCNATFSLIVVPTTALTFPPFDNGSMILALMTKSMKAFYEGLLWSWRSFRWWHTHTR